MKKYKKDYPTSEETQDVLRGHEADVAKAYGCNPSYIYNIKNGDEPDNYPPFREWFQACAFGGSDMMPYLSDLSEIAFKAKHGATKNKDLCTDCFDQIKHHADRIRLLTDIVADGETDEREIDLILSLCQEIESGAKLLREKALGCKSAFKTERAKRQTAFVGNGR